MPDAPHPPATELSPAAIAKHAKQDCIVGASLLAAFPLTIVAVLLILDSLGVFGQNSPSDPQISHGGFWHMLVLGVWAMLTPWLLGWWLLASRPILYVVAAEHAGPHFDAGNKPRTAVRICALSAAVCTVAWGFSIVAAITSQGSGSNAAALLVYLPLGLGALSLLGLFFAAHRYTRTLGTLIPSTSLSQWSRRALATTSIGAIMAFFASGGLYDAVPEAYTRIILGLWIIAALVLLAQGTVIFLLVREVRRCAATIAGNAPPANN